MERAFKKILKKDLDWEFPKTFLEKLQWLKLYHRTDMQTQCADKIGLEIMLQKKTGEQYLIPNLQIVNSTRELIPDNLPASPHIVQCNHNYGGRTIVHNIREINKIFNSKN